MRWLSLLLLTALLWYGCGSVGDPLPPALHVPQRVTDLSAVGQGGQILIQFTLPSHTTENLVLRKPATIELRVGPAPSPFDLGTWEAGAKLFTDLPAGSVGVTYSAPGAEWIGKDVVIAVKLFSEKGSTAGWSNLVTLSVAPPLDPVRGLQARNVAEGVRLTWQGSGPRYRVYRRTGDEPGAASIGETGGTEYTDTKTEYGKTYHYSVEAFRNEGNLRAISEPSPEVEITPKDEFAPPVPAGLAAVVSTGSIELAWERSIAPDLAGYRIYRAEGAGAFEKLAETRQGPSYSDRKIGPGKTYRYAVTAFDLLGNESDKSAVVSATAP
jgi:hypothetical protein